MSEDPVQESRSVPPEPGQDPLIGKVIDGRFTIEALVARGAIARVYRAADGKQERKCALKIFDPRAPGLDDGQFRTNFVKTLSVAAKLSHPNTASVLGFGVGEGGLAYVGLELLEGRTLHRAMREGGAIPEDRVVHIARQVCRSLREAHHEGLVHRDLRPGNIFLTEREGEHDFVKVTDYGLLQESNEGSGRDILGEVRWFGAPRYMAPEQIAGGELDARTDIYSLGIILYEMIAGRAPFDATRPERILQAHRGEEPPPLKAANSDVEVSPALDQIVMQCLRKAPDQRFGSIDELLEALKNADCEPASADAPTSHSKPAAIAPPGESPRTSPSKPPPPRPLSNRPPAPAPLDDPDRPAPDPAGAVAAERIKALLAHSDGVTTVLSQREMEEQRKVPQNLLAVLAGAALVVGLAGVAAYAIRLTDGASASVSIETTPAGATVRTPDGRTLCTPTPCAITLDGEHAREGRKVVVALEGYKLETRLVSPGTPSLAITLSR
jgi:eukaryotic-like serine/threonine-protein kinase